MNKPARVIINLGAPDKPTPECAENFLFSFLSDKHVLSVPAPIRILLAFYISKKRKYAYAENLKSIFYTDVHLLKKHTQDLAEKISEFDNQEVFVAYRYGKDDIISVVKYLQKKGYKYFQFVPMYPQQTCSTTDSALEQISKILKKDFYKIAPAYYNDDDFISALAQTVAPKTKTLVVSFHSIPISHAERSPYVQQCKITTKLLAEKLGINDVHIAWQSAMPKGKWLRPSAIEVVNKLVQEGKKSISVIAPSFACDCSETIIELACQLKEHFMQLGGENFSVSQCLNSSDNHVKLFSKIFKNLENE